MMRGPSVVDERETIERLFAAGKDTVDIAAELKVSEAAVANALAALRDRRVANARLRIAYASMRARSDGDRYVRRSALADAFRNGLGPA